MLNSLETAHPGTIVPFLTDVPSHQHSNDPHFAYAIGPLAPDQLISLHAALTDGEEITLLVPTTFPSSPLTHPVFKEGYEWGYLDSHVEEEAWTVPKLLNDLYHNLADLSRFKQDPDFSPWTLGFLLGELANVAEWDRTLALTGLAHVCFLVPFFTQERPSDWPRYEPYHAASQHDRVVKAYRARVRAQREQGESFAEAQRSALCYEVPASAFKVIGPDGWPLDM